MSRCQGPSSMYPKWWGLRSTTGVLLKRNFSPLLDHLIPVLSLFCKAEPL